MSLVHRCAVGLCLLPPMLALASCADTFPKSPGDDTKQSLKKQRMDDGSKIRYVEVRAKKRREDAAEIFRPPYELQGYFEVELTVGVFKEKKVENLGDGIFGMRIESATPASGEFYACYAQYSANPAGLDVFVTSHDGVQGTSVLFEDTKIVDMFAVSNGNGSTITFSAGPSGLPPVAPTPLATVAIASPLSPHHAGYAVFGIADKSRVGFTNFTIPENDGPPTTKNKAADVQQKFYRGSAHAMSAAKAMNRRFPIVSAAQHFNDQAILEFEQAKTAAEGLPDGKDKKTTIKKLEKLIKDIHKANFKIQQKQEAAQRAVLRLLARSFKSADTIHKKIDPLAE